MILKYKANKKKFKKPIELSMKDVLASDARIFINNIQTISDKKIKQKQKNYVKPTGMYIPSKKDYLQFDSADVKIEIQPDIKERLNNMYENCEDAVLKNHIEKMLNFLKELDDYEGL